MEPQPVANPLCLFALPIVSGSGALCSGQAAAVQTFLLPCSSQGCPLAEHHLRCCAAGGVHRCRSGAGIHVCHWIYGRCFAVPWIYSHCGGQRRGNGSHQRAHRVVHRWSGWWRCRRLDCHAARAAGAAEEFAAAAGAAAGAGPAGGDGNDLPLAIVAGYGRGWCARLPARSCLQRAKSTCSTGGLLSR